MADAMPLIELPDASPIPGLRWRTYQGAGDIPALVEVANAAMRENGVSWVWTEGALANDLENATHGDPAGDIVLALVEERLVAWSRVDWVDSNEGERLYTSVCHVHPRWRRRRLGTALLDLAEGRRRDMAVGHAFPGPRALTTWAEEVDEGARTLLSTRGYRRVRSYLHMVRPDLEDISVPELPPGLEVRPATPELLPRVWAAMDEAFRDHFGEHDMSEAAYRRWISDPDFDLGLLVVAFDGEEVAAAVHGVISPAENERNGYRRGWADPVFTRRAWRRRGLASALLGRALVRLRERGMTSAQLDVDAENPNQALGLYERHGFSVDHATSEWRRPLVV